jgi:hypothetical protein
LGTKAAFLSISDRNPTEAKVWLKNPSTFLVENGLFFLVLFGTRRSPEIPGFGHKKLGPAIQFCLFSASNRGLHLRKKLAEQKIK